MPAERLLLCGRKPLNREPEAGAVEITVLRVSEIAPAILIMPPHSYPLCPLATSTGGGKEGERNREKQREREKGRPVQSPAPISPSGDPTEKKILMLT